MLVGGIFSFKIIFQLHASNLPQIFILQLINQIRIDQVTGSEDTTARMWSVTTPETDCLGVFVGHASYVNAVAIVGGMEAMAAAAEANKKVWNIPFLLCRKRKSRNFYLRRSHQDLESGF